MVPPASRARTSREVAARVVAAVAAVGTVGGVVAIVVAVVAGPGPGLTGYVSESGIPGSPYAPVFGSGMFALATALLLLAVALPSALRTAAGLLAVAALCTALSAAVTCSDGCPLPPFEEPTVADLVHGGAAAAAAACVVFAMAAVAVSPDAAPRLRRMAAGAFVASLPMAGAVALAMLVVGRSTLVGVLERVFIALAAGWVLATAVTLATTPPTPPRRVHPAR
ncbi:DUF998 domain-containing protein [Micromonospora sp. NPDC000207]|uniref:DUF998 domain-containing protein n=1 Tax=Micromonospora sp. NPDC000207 TaxID=3154246 RepID=UPI00331AD56E